MTEVAKDVAPANLRVGFAAASRVECVGVEQTQKPEPKGNGTQKVQASAETTGGRAETATGAWLNNAQERREENAGVVCVVDVLRYRSNRRTCRLGRDMISPILLLPQAGYIF